jgi:hypothetical protein
MILKIFLPKEKNVGKRRFLLETQIFFQNLDHEIGFQEKRPKRVIETGF